MEVRRVDSNGVHRAAEVYEVSELSAEEIGEPSQEFREFVRRLKDFPELNRFTLDEFSREVRRRYSTPDSG